MDCPRCARTPPPDARFCPSCGSPLVTGAGRYASPDAYTPGHLARRILTSRNALEGERKQVTVLFADVKGSLELLADRDPEEAEQVLGHALDAMMEAVHRYEGTVNQVMGDGVMALFGAPLAHEDHAVRACYAALRMQERVGAYGDAMQRDLGLPLQIRVGLNSGEVLVRSIGHDLHMSYVALGPTVHLAARMEQMAKPASILATVETVRLTRGQVRSRSLGPVAVKGLEAPVEVHEIVAADTRARADLPARGLAPFVGREDELARLDEVLETVRKGQARVVAIVGEAGVGKSRLTHEVLTRARAAGCRVVTAQAVSYGRALAQRPGIEMIRRYFEVEALDDPGLVRERIRTVMVALDPALEESVPAVLWLLGALRDDSPFRALDVDTRRRRALEAVHRLLAREAARQPFVLAIEDLQWADSETLVSLHSLVERLPPATLLLVNYRPDYQDGWGGVPIYTRLRLPPLPRRSARALLASLLGPDPSVVPLARRLLERAGGNPLFLEECVRDLATDGTLAGERGGYTLARPVTAVDVPATVRAVLEARIDRLPEDRKRLLQAAAVIGEQFPAALLEAIAEGTPEETRLGLAELQAAELLVETALFPDAAYAFPHALAHDVAYEGVRHDRRRALHRRVMEAIERRRAGAVGDDVEAVAHHAFHGEAWEEAVTHLRAAAAKTQSRLAGREAAAFLERAILALGHLPETAANRALAIDLRLELDAALAPLGEHARGLAALREAAARAAASGDDARLARARSFESTALWNLGRAADAIEAGEHALAIARRLGDRELQVVSTFSVGGAARTLGDYRSAAAALRESVALLATGDRRTFGLAGLAAVLVRGHLAWSLAELGDFPTALAYAEEAVQLAQAADHPYSLAHAHLALGGTLVRQGRFTEAATLLERGVALCKDAPALYPATAGDLGLVSVLTGRVARGLELLEHAVAQAERLGRLGRLSLVITHLGEACLLAGRIDEAMAHGRAALARARAQMERGNQVYALRLLGTIAAQQTPLDAGGARAAFGEALALAETLGMLPMAARCHLGLARLARLTGDGAAADRHLATAADAFRAMGMAFWLSRLHLDAVRVA